MRRIWFLCSVCVALSLAACGGGEDAAGQAIGGDAIELVPSDSASRRLWECLGELRRKGSHVHLHELSTDVAAYDSGSEAKDTHQFLGLRLRRNQAQVEHEKDLAAGRSCGLGSGDVLAEAVVDSFRWTAVAVGAVSSSTSTEGDYRRVYEQWRLALVLADQVGEALEVCNEFAIET